MLKFFYGLIPYNKSVNIYYKKQKIDDVIKNIKNSKSFEDLFFKAEVRNITYIDKNIKYNKFIIKSDIVTLQKFTFNKLYEIYPDIMSDEIELKNLKIISIKDDEKVKINFGQYGNINVYNCIIFLLQNKNWGISRITRMDLEKGLYVIKLFIQGKPKSILLDNNFATLGTKELNKTPSFIAPKMQNFWILLIEKAIAKINRSYGNLIRAVSSEIISSLSEAPLIAFVHNLCKKKTLWNIFLESGNKNWVIFSEFESMSIEHYNIENFISYFVINIFSVNNKKYIELSVPEINDKLSIKIIKAKLQTLSNIPIEDLENKNYFPDKKLKSSKIIFMSFDTFFTFFYKTCILKYDPSYIYNFQKFQINTNKYNLTKLKITKTTKIFLTMHLKQTRYYIKANNYDIPLSRIFIGKLYLHEKFPKNSMSNKKLKYNTNSSLDTLNEENYEYNLEYISSIYGKTEKQILELNLQEGTYYIFFKIYSESQMNIVLSTYSDEYLQFEQNLDDTDNKILHNTDNFLNFLNSFFNNFLIKNCLHDAIQNNEDLIYSHSLSEINFGYSIMKFENSSKDKILNVELNLDYNAMNLISHSKEKKKNNNFIDISTDSTSYSNRNVNGLSLCIPPGTKEIVIFEWEKNFNEISINIKPNFYIEQLNMIDESILKAKIKNYIFENVFYYEIFYRKGVFLILINESDYDFTIRVHFEKLNNLKIIYPINTIDHSTLEVEQANCSKSYINLQLEKDDEISYKINFNLKKKI